jgi:predicted dehydrogenase
MKKSNIILIGSGFMAREYLRVFKHLKRDDVTIVGRSAGKVEKLRSEFPDYEYHIGGLESYLANNKAPKYAINAVGVTQLQQTTMQLLKAGVESILLEKPGDLEVEGLEKLLETSNTTGGKVNIGYNRRFYASTAEIIKQAVVDGGITGIHFEFTEWTHRIDPNLYDKASLNKWIIANSSHVIDTVFYLIGFPKVLNSTVLGEGLIDWHPSGSIFTGSGLSDQNIPFTYHSNWTAPGRWAIEVLTKERRFYLKPMEKLQVQLKGSVAVNEHPIDDKDDLVVKHGLLLQTTDFLSDNFETLVSLEEQIKSIHLYNKIGNY